jgi:hypothetical protein
MTPLRHAGGQAVREGAFEQARCLGKYLPPIKAIVSGIALGSEDCESRLGALRDEPPLLLS